MPSLFNSMGQKLQPFKPRKAGQVKIFTCGPSIYRRPHIGNYRSFMYEDILVRYLEYVGYQVDRCINFTDVEDKSILEAETKGQDVLALTRQVSRHFFDETKLLRIKLPKVVPRSSTTVKEAAMIAEKLLKKGVAYQHKGSVYFDPLKIDDFGKLFGLDMKKWPKKPARFSRDTYNGRRWNMGDFILWHGSRNEPFWESPIGPGRPSWNIQDPAMIIKHLGPTIDINCGGIDNIYRHHDYNIAVMEAYTGKEFARYYLHGEHLIVEGKSMSKSRGNILFPEDVMARGYSAAALRFMLLHTHYRRKLDFTWDGMKEAALRLEAVRSRVKELTSSRRASGPGDAAVDKVAQTLPGEFEKIAGEDLAAGAAFDRVAARLEEISVPVGKNSAAALKEALQKIDHVLQVLF